MKRSYLIQERKQNDSGTDEQSGFDEVDKITQTRNTKQSPSKLKNELNWLGLKMMKLVYRCHERIANLHTIVIRSRRTKDISRSHGWKKGT